MAQHAANKMNNNNNAQKEKFEAFPISRIDDLVKSGHDHFKLAIRDIGEGFANAIGHTLIHGGNQMGKVWGNFPTLAREMAYFFQQLNKFPLPTDTLEEQKADLFTKSGTVGKDLFVGFKDNAGIKERKKLFVSTYTGVENAWDILCGNGDYTIEERRKVEDILFQKLLTLWGESMENGARKADKKTSQKEDQGPSYINFAESAKTRLERLTKTLKQEGLQSDEFAKDIVNEIADIISRAEKRIAALKNVQAEEKQNS